MGFWNDVKDAFGVGGSETGKDGKGKDEAKARKEAERLAEEAGVSRQEAATTLKRTGSADAARREFEANGAGSEAKRVEEAMTRYGIDRSSAESIVSEVGRLERVGPEAARREYGRFLIDPESRIPDDPEGRRGSYEHMVFQSTQSRKAPMVYDDLTPAQNAEIADRARLASRDMSRMSDEQLVGSFENVMDSIKPPPLDSNRRRDWIVHMSFQQQYQDMTGRSAPEGIPVLPREYPAIVIHAPDEPSRKRMDAMVSHLAGLEDGTLRKRFAGLPDSDAIDFPKLGPARQARVRGLLSEESVGLTRQRGNERDGILKGVGPSTRGKAQEVSKGAAAPGLTLEAAARGRDPSGASWGKGLVDGGKVVKSTTGHAAGFVEAMIKHADGGMERRR